MLGRLARAIPLLCAVCSGCALVAGYDFGKYREGAGGRGGGGASSTSSSPGTGGAVGGASSTSIGGAGSDVSAVASSGTGGAGGAFTVLAAQQNAPFAIALDATSVFWTTLIPSNPTGTVNRVSKDGSGATTLASNLWEPSAIAVDTAYVYFVSSQAGVGSLMRIPKTGGAPTVVFSGANVCDVTVYAGTVYWAADAGVYEISGNGSPSVLAATSSPMPCSAIAVDASGVYWLTFGTAGMLMHADGAGLVPLATNQPNANSLAVNATSVVWSRFDGTVLKLSKADGMVTTVSPPSPTLVSKVGADDLHFYWAQYQQVFRSPISAPFMPTVLEAFTTDVTSFALDTNDVYASIASNFMQSDGTIVKFPK